MEFDLTEPEHLNSAASDSLYFSDLFGDQSEVIAALQDKSSLTGVPMGVLTKADNRHLPKSYDVGGYDENLKRAIAANPGRASYFKDYLPEWEEVTKELVKRQKMTGKLSKEALSRLTDEELAESMKALEAPDVEAAQEEIQKLETQNAVINFMDSMFNDDWRELGDEALKTRLSVVSDATGINIDDIDFKDLRETKGVDMGNLVNLFGARDIVEVSGMLRDWSKYSDLDLSKVDKNSPLDQQLYKLELLRREREMLRDETLREKILNGALGSVPFMLEFAMTGGLAGGLHEGASLGGKQFLRTLINFERNGFLKGYREVLRRGGWAGIGRAIKQGVSEAMKSGARRMPFYIPKITMETMGQVAPRTITLPGENGNPEVNLSEGDITDFFQKFMTNALSQYTELASEEVGALLPNITPQFIRSYVVNGLFKDPMTRKISERLMQTVSFDGLLGEFTEEEIGNFMMYGVTLLENAMQFRRENTAMVDTPLLGKEDTLATLGSIGIQSALLGGMAHVFSNQGALAMLRNATRARALIESADGVVDSIQKLGPIVNNTNQLEWALDQVNGGEKTPVTITVPAAEALFQSIKEETPEIQNDMLEAFEAMGLNMKVIEKHRREGTDIVLYDNRIKAVAAKFKSGHDAMHKIYDNAATMVFGKSAKDFTGDTFPKEQLDKMLEDRVIRDNAMKRWQGIINESLRTAQENAIAAGNPVGLTQSAIRNYESMMPFLANYLGTNALGEEGIKRVDAMVEGISFEFIKDPEAFDPNQAMSKIIGSGTVRELENRVNELKTKLETMQKDGNATGEEYLKLSEEYSTAKQELDEAKANPVFQTVQSLNDSISAAAKQEIGSGETSLDQVAAGFKKIDFKPGTVNLDLGGGKFDRGTEYLAERGVTNLVYDPVNRSAESNTRIYDAVRNGGVDTVTCNNVLNVIKEAGARSNVVLQAAKALKPGGVAYFTVYEGDGTGNSRETSKGWQEHRKTADYVDEIKQHFGDVVRKGKIIEARNPIVEGKTSAWFNEGFGAAPALFQVDNVWTGSAADYDRPDMNYVGTGEKNQSFSYGLYGSSRRGVGEWYANADVNRKQRERNELIREMREKGLPDPSKFKPIPADTSVRFSYEGERVPSETKHDGDNLKWETLFSLEAGKNYSIDHILYSIARKAKDEGRWNELPNIFGNIKVIGFEGNSTSASDRSDLVVGHIHDLLDLNAERDNNLDYLRGVARWYIEREVSSGREGDISASNMRKAISDELDRRIKKLSGVRGRAVRTARKRIESAKALLSDRATIVFGMTIINEETEWDIAKRNADEAYKKEVEAYEKKWKELNKPVKRNLYRQTFWPDKEENLLDWDLYVPQEQLNAVLKQVEAEGYDMDSDWGSHRMKMYSFSIDSNDGGKTLEVELRGSERCDLLIDRESSIIKECYQHPSWVGKRLSDVVGEDVAKQIFEEKLKPSKYNSNTLHGKLRLAKEDHFIEFDKSDPYTGDRLYHQLSRVVGSPKKASELLYQVGIDGATYVGGSGARNYVVYNDKDIRVDEHIQFQKQDRIYRGVFLSDFKYSHDSLIGLFNGANASTLPHESAHWLKRCMEDLIGAGLANDKMIEDMNTINAWLDKQAYSLEAAREQGLAKTDKSGKEYFSASEMREEYFARAFETYLTEGKFPETSNSKLRSALHRLANALKTIYRNALALNAPIDDSIRAFFDGLFAVDQVVEDTSTLEAILRVVDAGAVALPKDALKNLEKDVELAREDAETEANLAALRAYCKGLSEQKKGWRDEAKAAYLASKAEQAFAYVRRGHRISEDFLRNVLKLDEETIAILKGKKLTVKGTPAKVKSEEKTEAPVQEETATSAEATAEEPEATAENEVALDGTPEQFDALDGKTSISLTDIDQYGQSNILASLLGDRMMGPLGKKIYVEVKSATESLGITREELLGKAYETGIFYFTHPQKYRTKDGLAGYITSALTNEKNNLYEQQKRNPAKQSLTTNKDGDEVQQDVEDRSANPGVYVWSEIIENLEAVAKDWDTEEEKIIAKIVVEHTKADDIVTDTQIFREYKEDGGKYQKSAADKILKKVRAEIKKRMGERGIALEARYLQTGNATTEELPADILETMRETGYEDIMSMLDDLRTAVGERQFIKNYMLDKEAQYRDSFPQNPVWNSETGALRYMDALLRALKLTEGMKYNERKKLAIQKARDEVEALKVRDIVSEERNARMSLKSNAESIMKALKDKKHDKEAAITAAVFMHANAVRLEAIRKVREKLDNTRNYVRRLSKLKPGSTVEGDAVTAIVDVLFHLKLTARRPAWSGEPGAPGTVTGVFREIVERSIGEMGLTPDMLGKDGYPTAGQIVEAEMGQWSEWLMNQISGGAGFVDDYRDLTFDQFEEVRDFVEWLRDRGHDTVANDKATFAAKRRETMDGILASLDENATGKYTRHADKTATEKLRAMTRTGQHQLKTLVFMSHFLDGNTEFYGEHKIGAFRKLQLKVSEGVARQQFWYQKISSAVKPHVLALMKSAKERKLRFEVKNDITKDVYDDIHGETAAFVLLNAGQVDGRQRLMSGFGWTEEELDDNLRQFTEEDFKHAEAIWAELNTLGRELAKVFYQQRHYRMKWAKLAPINLILNDGKGTHIMSEGGYYPIAYSYREGEEVRNDDIMNPFRAPARLARPSATYGREARVENAALLLSPTVIERSIMENARYIGLWEPLRMMNSIWTDGAVKRSIIRNFSEEAYDTLRDLMNQVNDPDRGEKGKWKKIVSYLGSAMAVAALGFKATTMAKQYASLSIGAERLKAVDPKTGQMRNFFMESFQKGLTNLKKLRDTVSNESPFLRDRYNLIDKDLKVINSEFKGKFGKAVDTYRRWAFFGLKWNDLNVAVVQWDAAYNWALFTQKDMTESEARAFADDFVASTQGGARDVDIPEVQLSTFGRLITPFFGPSAAAANTRIAGLSTMRDMTPAERIIFVVDNLLVPGLEQAVVMAVSAGAIGWAASGGDDEDAWDRVQQKFLISMLTEPLSGIPLIQDISDAAIRSAVTGKPVQSGVFDVSLFRPLEESARDMNQIIRNMKKMEDFGYSLYLGASIAGILTRMPIIQVYEDYERMLINNNFWFSDERAENQLKGEKRK